MPPMLSKAQATGNQMPVPNAPEEHTSKKRNFDDAISPIVKESKEEDDSTGTKNLQEDSDSNEKHSTIAQRGEEEKTKIQAPYDDSTDVGAPDVTEKERNEESGPQPAPAKKRKLVHANTLADLAAVKRKGPTLLLRKGTAASTPPKNQIKTVGISSTVIVCSAVCQPLLCCCCCFLLQSLGGQRRDASKSRLCKVLRASGGGQVIQVRHGDITGEGK